MDLNALLAWLRDSWQAVQVRDFFLDLKVQLALIAAAINVLFFFIAPNLIRFFFGPRLKLAFNDKRPFLIQNEKHNYLPVDPATKKGKEYNDRIVRVRVTNRARRPAKGCRGYLAGIRVWQGWRYRDVGLYDDFIPLKWSYSRLTGNDQKPVKPGEITLLHKVSDYLDVAATYHGHLHKPKPSVELQLDYMPARYANVIEPKKFYLLDIIVTAEEAKPRRIKLKLTWDGTWESLTAKRSF